MSQARILAIAFIVIGALLAITSALADQVGLGAPTSSFGWKQLLGLIFGIIILVAGIILLRQGDEPYDEEEEDEEYVEEVDVTEAEGEGEGERTAAMMVVEETTEHDRQTVGSEAEGGRRVVSSDELRDDATRERS